MTSQVALFVVVAGIGVGPGVGVCAVAECKLGDLGGVADVIGSMMFPSPSSADSMHSGVATISRVSHKRPPLKLVHLIMLATA